MASVDGDATCGWGPVMLETWVTQWWNAGPQGLPLQRWLLMKKRKGAW